MTALSLFEDPPKHLPETRCALLLLLLPAFRRGRSREEALDNADDFIMHVIRVPLSLALLLWLFVARVGHILVARGPDLGNAKACNEADVPAFVRLN